MNSASSQGYKKSLMNVIEQAADVNAQVGRLADALQASSFDGHCKVAGLCCAAGLLMFLGAI